MENQTATENKDFMTKKKNAIGILGGMGPEATAELYLRIVRIFQQRYGAVYDADFPEFVINSIPLPDVVQNMQEMKKIPQMLIEGAQKLEQAGVECIVIPCNSVTMFLSAIKKMVDIPVINIVEEVAREVAKRSVQTVGLLATRTTIQSNVYQNAFTTQQCIVPTDYAQAQITEMIMNILAGKKNKSDSQILCSIIDDMRASGAEQIILGCTELSLIDIPRPCLIDTIQVLAEIAVRCAIRSQSPKPLNKTIPV